MFDRRRQRNIAVYASKEKLASRGRFYNEDDLAAYDVLDYDIDVDVAPERQWLDGRTQLTLQDARADRRISSRCGWPTRWSCDRSISDEFGRLFSLRVTNQNTVLVNLPASLLQDTELTLTIDYSGRLAPQAPDRETLALQQDRGGVDRACATSRFRAPSRASLYSNRSYWYPQPPITDYATATIQHHRARGVRLRRQRRAAARLAAADRRRRRGARSRARSIMFTAERPVRYLAFLVSRFARADRCDGRVRRASRAPTTRTRRRGRRRSSGAVVQHARSRSSRPIRARSARGRELAERAADIVQFYESIVGDSPYPSFTLALVENALPGGHSPGYFAVLNQPLPNTPLSLAQRSRRVRRAIPEFFLAHEIAHQWWGQAVGWQQLSRAVAERGLRAVLRRALRAAFRGDEVFANVMRQMRKWAIDESDQGPVYLGYRLGHIRTTAGRSARIVYNKGAAVLHMLRRLVGDEAFFRGIRRFYVESRFTKVGTEDFRQAMEAESGRSLERFFERWIYGSTLPRLTFTLSRRSRRRQVACCASSRPARSSTCRSPSRCSTPTGARSTSSCR